MGIFDIFKRHKDDDAGGSTALKERVTGMMSGHSDKVNQGLDKAGQMADQQTGNRYTDQINTGVSKAKDMFAGTTEQGSGEAGAETPHPDQGAQGGDSAPPPQPPQS